MTSSKLLSEGNHFEDFRMGQNLIHGVPRTITESDATLYLALTGSRFALHCAETVAQKCGFRKAPFDNLLVFHIAFGKTVNDVSLNAVANLGYAEVQFLIPCFAGDTISVSSKVIGLKENSNGKTGVVYVHSIARNQSNETVLHWKRWVMVNKKNHAAKAPESIIPKLLSQVDFSTQPISGGTDFSKWNKSDSDCQATFNELEIGDIIFHRDGMTINDSDHSLATRLYQNNARVHFDQAMMKKSNHGQRLVYGGHIISMCRALSYNGLGNTIWISSINGGTHSNPSFAGDTIYCQSEIIDKQPVKGNNELGIVRIRMIGTKNNTPNQIGSLYETTDKRTNYHSDVVLDLDYNAFVII